LLQNLLFFARFNLFVRPIGVHRLFLDLEHLVKIEQTTTDKEPPDWAFPLVRKCVIADAWAIIAIYLFKFALRIDLIDSRLAPLIDHLTTGTIIGVVGTIAVVVMYLWMKPGRDPGNTR